MTMYIIITSYSKDNYIIEELQTKSLKKVQLQHILIEGRQKDKEPEGKTEVMLYHGSSSVGDYQEHVNITHCFKHCWVS